jgi:hypothetical protein
MIFYPRLYELMCDVCIPILGRYAKAHTGNPCAVAKTLYCSLCATYGHSYKGCARAADRDALKSPPFSEEKITVTFPSKYETWVEVTDDDEGKCVRAMLIANNIVPMSCQEKGRSEKKDVRENTKRLAEFLEKQGKKLILVKPYVPKKPRPNLTYD